jgi:transcriptional regulator of arginine metabolism
MPSDQELREIRQREILAVLHRSPVASQRDLVELLRRQGIAATQSSVSRDLRDLGVARVGGRYLAPAEPEQGDSGLGSLAAFLRAVKTAGAHLTVVLTTVGAAQSIGLAIDRAAWPEVVGTISGDDTVFVATAGADDQARLLHRLGRFVEGRRPRVEGNHG